MAVQPAQTIYKKNKKSTTQGTIALSRDQKYVVWTPQSGADASASAISMAISDIKGLQQTPETSPTARLKCTMHLQPGEEVSASYTFEFLPTDPSQPRREMTAWKEAISALMVENAAENAAEAAAPSAVGATSSSWYDDKYLLGDMELQQSLMTKDPVLHQTYMDALEAKPPSVSGAAFNTQFWSTRTNMLRAHAIETNQKKAAYNALSAVKTYVVDNEVKLDLSPEHIQMILQQHPLVKRIYNENVPKLDERIFWSRFFLSKLSKRLRGERVNDNAAPDALFDKYDAADDINMFTSKITLQQVPHTIDLAGNVENQGGFRSGNRPDQEMRPQANVPIVRTLNSLSEKLLANVAPADHDPAATSGMDEGTYRELHLRDLQGDPEATRIILNIKEQNKFFSGQESQNKSADATLLERQDPTQVMTTVRANLSMLRDDDDGGLDLHKGTGVDDESDSDDDETAAGTRTTNGTGPTDHVGSRRARKKAQDQIFDGMSKKRGETYGPDSGATGPMGIQEDLSKRCYVTNATTSEFLRQFWNAFLSGNPDRAQELAYHVESLKKSMDRIEALANEAEEARTRAIEAKRLEIQEYYKTHKKRLKDWRPDMVRGGRKEVLALLAPMIDGLEHAQKLYQAALEAEGLRATTE